MDFFNVKTTDAAHTVMKQAFARFALDKETAGIETAQGRVLAQEIVSAIDVPHFDRSVVDGYALRIADVQAHQRRSPLF